MAAGRLIAIIALALAAACLAMELKSCAPTSAGGIPKLKTERVVIGGQPFDLELALDEKARQKGLMDRTSIPDHGGMLFVFPDSQVQVQRFWMAHCLVDMDIIYLDPQGTVTATHHMKMEPPQRANGSNTDYEARVTKRYSSGYPAQFAIEIQAGWLDRLKLRVGVDRVPVDVAKLKAMAR